MTGSALHQPGQSHPRRAWLVTPPHPVDRAYTFTQRDAAGKVVSTRIVETRRRITRRIGGEVRTVIRLPVAAVLVLYTLPTLRLARVRDWTGSEYYGRFDCLASTREKFLSCFLRVAGLPNERPALSGDVKIASDETPAAPVLP